MAVIHKFATLDGLRGIAALAVITRHAPQFFRSISILIPQQDGTISLVGPFYESYLAVDFFFVLSGFVLAHAQALKLCIR
jgi:peptidoglycan/LPS O-acetylase OafA/YrhL